MSDEPETPINGSLFPQTVEDDFKVTHWCNGVLGRHFAFASSCYLKRLDHCKATRLPRHEFLMVYLTLEKDGKEYETCMIIDRCPAIGLDFEDKPATPKNNSTTSLLSSAAPLSSRSASLSPSQSNHSKAMHGKGNGKVPARDHIMIPKLGRRTDLNSLAQATFGDFDILNTLTIGEGHTPMSTPQLATALEIVHNLALFYTVKKYQCYWFTLLVFLIARKQTQGAETSQKRIMRMGKLYKLSPGHNAEDDEAVAVDEYDKAWAEFEVSN